MKKIVVYANDSCGACASIVPMLRDLANRRKVQIEVVDVDKCHTEKCNSIRYVPYITIDGREIRSAEELEKALK